MTPKNARGRPVTKLCLALETFRRTEEGRSRDAKAFLSHFFPQSGATAADRLFHHIPKEVRAELLSNWGIRGKKSALRDDDEKVRITVADALAAGDIDAGVIEEGVTPEILIDWIPLDDWWAFFRGSAIPITSVRKALGAARDLSLFDERWFLDHLQLKGQKLDKTDVICAALSKDQIVAWISAVHTSGDASPTGLLTALGWETVLAKTAHDALVYSLDALARDIGLTDEPQRRSDVPRATTPPHAGAPESKGEAPKPTDSEEHAKAETTPEPATETKAEAKPETKVDAPEPEPATETKAEAKPDAPKPDAPKPEPATETKAKSKPVEAATKGAEPKVEPKTAEPKVEPTTAAEPKAAEAKAVPKPPVPNKPVARPSSQSLPSVVVDQNAPKPPPPARRTSSQSLPSVIVEPDPTEPTPKGSPVSRPSEPEATPTPPTTQPKVPPPNRPSQQIQAVAVERDPFASPKGPPPSSRPDPHRLFGGSEPSSQPAPAAAPQNLPPMRKPAATLSGVGPGAPAAYTPDPAPKPEVAIPNFPIPPADPAWAPPRAEPGDMGWDIVYGVKRPMGTNVQPKYNFDDDDEPTSEIALPGEARRG